MTDEDKNNIKELRKITGFGLVHCKRAYVDADCNIKKALNLLKYNENYNSLIKRI